MKKCSGCGITLPLTEFHRDLARRDQRQRTCKACARKALVERRAKMDPATRLTYDRRANLSRSIRKVEMTEAAYSMTLKSQGGRCAVSGCAMANGTTRLRIDHDHETGKVRGLICNSHNLGLGKIGDTLAAAVALAKYLKNSCK